MYVLASIPGQGKTTTALLLEKYFREQGLKVACLQMNKGQFDVDSYLNECCYHYSIPLEAAKSREEFERWVPEGFDIYLIEITFAYSLLGVAYVDLFGNINEIISYDLKNEWKKAAFKYTRSRFLWKDTDGTLSDLWDIFHNRNVRKIYTKSPVELEGPYVNDNFELRNPEEFVYDEIRPGYKFPSDSRKAIAVGAFPAEYWDIFPNLKWYGFDYASFMQRLRRKDYDLAIVGRCLSRNLKFCDKPEDKEMICYQPSVYCNITEKWDYNIVKGDIMAALNIIKTEPAGTPLEMEGGCFAAYSNKYWVCRNHPDLDIIKKEGNILFCNGWILPQYLIRDGYLEVE